MRRSKNLFGIIATVLVLWHLYVFFPVVFPPAVHESTKILSGSGDVLYEIIPLSSKSAVSKEAVPELFQELLLLQEDQNFRYHPGVDIVAIGKNIWNMLRGESFAGGSTITSQYIKLAWYPDELRTPLQKIREFYGAFIYERFVTKDDILHAYLEQVYFGNRMYGVEAASQGYFGKSVSTLAPIEMAMLVVTIPSPDRFNPTVKGNRDRAISLLEKAKDKQRIANDLYERALDMSVYVKKPQSVILAPHFVQEVLVEMRQKYPDFDHGGYTVKTTLSLPLQKDMEQIVAKHTATLTPRNVTNGSALAISPQTGAILGMVGSKNFFATDIDGEVNMTTAKRQPGSSLKPFTYLAGVMSGSTLASVMYDIPTTFSTATDQDYMPRNYDLMYHGPVSVRQSLGSSLNIPAVKMLDMVGLPTWYNLLASFGITFPEDPDHYGLGITLGGGEVRMLDLLKAYAVLANGGKNLTPYMVEQVEKDGKILYKIYGRKGYILRYEPVFPLAVFLIGNALRDPAARSISFGIASRLQIHESVAVKTGTTKDYRDNWAFGYTPNIAVGVWVGNNDNTPMEAVTGITGAIPILYDTFMRHKSWFASKEQPPAQLIKRTVCATSGMLATDVCPTRKDEWFIPGTQPLIKDTWYKKELVDADSNLLWDDTCTGQQQEKVFVHFPPELMEWARGMKITLPPTRYCNEEIVPVTSFAITSPEEGAVYLLQEHLPRAAQKITIRVDGLGRLSSPLLLNDTPVAEEVDLPYVQTFMLEPGIYTVDLLEKRVQFTVKQK